MRKKVTREINIEDEMEVKHAQGGHEGLVSILTTATSYLRSVLLNAFHQSSPFRKKTLRFLIHYSRACSM